jgi:enterobacteria phage integrase
MTRGRPKTNDFPPYMTFDANARCFVVRNPLKGAKKCYAEEQEARKAALLIGELVQRKRAQQALDAGTPRMSELVDSWLTAKEEHIPWSAGTWRNNRSLLERIKRDLGDYYLVRVNALMLENWMTPFCPNADTWNKARHILWRLMRYAKARKFVTENVVEDIEPRSTSKVLAYNRKKRRQLTIEGYRAILPYAEPCVQLAMDLSLVTLQGRTEICRMRHDHFQRGYLRVIRQKVSSKSDMGFIKIAVTPQLEELRRRALRLSEIPSPTRVAPICEQALKLYEAGMGRREIAERLGSTPTRITQLICHERAKRRPAREGVSLLSPFLVHRVPEKITRRALEAKVKKLGHATAVDPNYLSHAFQAARDACGFFDDVPMEERPTFHEIRGLGGRVYEEGHILTRAQVQYLMTHSTPKTTAIYLEKRRELTDDDYVTVSAPMMLSQVLK